VQAFGDQLELAWNATFRSLPPGWDLSLRCQSTGLAPGERSEKWRALAEGPEGASLEGRGDDPIAALADLIARTRA
jgi:hypothetical protein